MTLPGWNDPALKAGTMIRTALWLISEVGMGNVFTKEQHRAAFPGVAQADRRLRDLRKYGWVIHTSAEDAGLNPDEQRLVAIGSPVWERGALGNAATISLTAKVRRTTLAQNDYQCGTCGIAGGETYPDAPHMTAVLVASRRMVTDSPGDVQTMFITECKRCRSGAATASVDTRRLLATIEALGPAERALFMTWAESGRRGALDRAWAGFRQLPAMAREKILTRLKGDP
jgi:hypothetical protein